MMMSRAYIGPWGKDGVKAFAYGRGMGMTYINAPDQTQLPSRAQSNAPADPTALNNAAKTNLLAAGYAGAECHTEVVYYPNGGGGSYTQNICSAPGYTGGEEANLVALMSPAQLAAQRAYEVAHGEGTSATPDYFQMTAGAPNISVSNSTGGGAATPAASNWFDVLTAPKPPATTAAPQQQAASQVPNVNNANTQQTTAPPPALPSFDFSSLLSGNNLYYVLGAGAVALFLFSKGKR